MEDQLSPIVTPLINPALNVFGQARCPLRQILLELYARGLRTGLKTCQQGYAYGMGTSKQGHAGEHVSD